MPGTDTYLGLRAFVDELVRCGLRDAVTSPGSRSTPLVLTLAREQRLRATSHLDERCGAFFALGLAKATGFPAALACTSGTAAANYAPAVIEAHEARVPLLVLTADRPPELRDVGAGQTIDQVKLYGSAAKWYFEVDDHPASPVRVRWLRQLACRAFWTALDGRPGPVHLNFALPRAARARRRRRAGRRDRRPAARAAGRGSRARARCATPAPALLEGLEDELKARPRAIVVAGRAERDPRLGAAVAAFAERAGDPAAGRAAVRRPPRPGRDRPLRRAAARRRAGRTCPELVLRVGDLPTSKPLRAWLRAARRAAGQPSTPRTPGRTRRAASATIVDRRPAHDARRAAHPKQAQGHRAGWTPGTRPTAPPPRAIAESVGPAG